MVVAVSARIACFCITLLAPLPLQCLPIHNEAHRLYSCHGRWRCVQTCDLLRWLCLHARSASGGSLAAPCWVLKPLLKPCHAAAPAVVSVSIMNNSPSGYISVSLGSPDYRSGTICADGFKNSAAKVVCR